MTSSIILLVVLQVFWLRSAYRAAESDLRKETNQLFRTTIFAMHDSLIANSVETVVRTDSSHSFERIIVTTDSMRARRRGDEGDSLVRLFNTGEKTAKIEIFSRNQRPTPDSIAGIIRPLFNKLKRGQLRSFVLRLGPDSLRVDSIRSRYLIALDDAGIDAPFEVYSFQGPRRARVQLPTDDMPGELISEIVPVGPSSRYAVSFTNVDRYLLRKITPEILFSVFLTLLTIAAFATMYRNIRSQQRLMKMKNDFISNITHELKTPMATVSVALEALKNFNALEDPKKTNEYISIALNELSRLTLMTDKILKTAVYEDKGVDLKPHLFDIDVLIQEVLTSMKLVFEKRKTVLSYTKEGTSFLLNGSQSHLSNVLYNLLDNALKYSAGEPVIHVMLASTADQVTIRVKDQGMGIPSAYQKRIFEKFFRVPSGDVHNTKGYGLGLSYVASVVHSHGGSITVISAEEQGSEFTLQLPKNIQAS